MPRKPKVEKKTITVVVNGKPVAVVLHPPTGSRKSWYAYWPGLVSSKSTGRATFADAVVVAEEMVKAGGKKPTVADAVLTDDEFELIQRAHYDRKQASAAKARAAKSLFSCLNAITAFREITGLSPITTASAADCAAFQRKALALPKNWRTPYLKDKETVARLSPNTVLKWSRALQAAFERANRNATNRKCVRGVVSDDKLLTANPWSQFPWIEGKPRPIRQFDGPELLNLLDYFEHAWPQVKIAGLLCKVFLWSSGRRTEIAGLTWASLRTVAGEYHFEVIGKWGVEKWFRVPPALYRSLLAERTDSPYVFAAYQAQLRNHHQQGRRPWLAARVQPTFDPVCLADWFHERIAAWSKDAGKGAATTHIFRKTSLQYARRGEDVNRRVAADARVSEGVMMTSYVKETDEELRQASNRSFARIAAGLPSEVARRYGYDASEPANQEAELRAAVEAQDWGRVAALSSKLARRDG